MVDSEAVHIGEFAWINDEPLGTRGLVESIEIDIRVVGAGESVADVYLVFPHKVSSEAKACTA